MVCTEMSTSTPSIVRTLPSVAIFTAWAAARSGSVISEFGTRREGQQAVCHGAVQRPRRGFAYTVGVPAVEAAGDVGRRDVRHDLFVGAERTPAVALAHVAVEVDDLGHGRPLTLSRSRVRAHS